MSCGPLTRPAQHADRPAQWHKTGVPRPFAPAGVMLARNCLSQHHSSAVVSGREQALKKLAGARACAEPVISSRPYFCKSRCCVGVLHQLRIEQRTPPILQEGAVGGSAQLKNNRVCVRLKAGTAAAQIYACRKHNVSRPSAFRTYHNAAVRGPTPRKANSELNCAINTICWLSLKPPSPQITNRTIDADLDLSFEKCIASLESLAES